MNHPALDPVPAGTIAIIKTAGADARRAGISRAGVPYAHPEMRAAWLAGWDAEPAPTPAGETLAKRFEAGGPLLGQDPIIGN